MPESRLQRELKKKHPFDSPAQEAMLNLLRTNDLFQNRFGRLFREYGLTASQYNVLRILRGEGQPLPCQEISERMIQVVPAMTGLIDRLEKQGLVQRKRSAEDRRVIFVELTEKAIQLLQNLDRPVSELHVELLRNLTEKEQQQLTRLLEKARRGI